ncbi:DUF6084 family protein [Methylocystis sp. SB2]|uniref:DUF6084 family protein n=1 Tax=Methylocystis sp. (strain SB2) TaxID=743836 RepID=UPI000429B216|nr:DUF6084 family protein [Methylocystis sp. SB2]ULO23362.1 DUF6084 family protein [Methylocystis sp. SB2]
MVDLDFRIEDVKVEKYSAAPLLLFELHVVNKTPDLPILNVMLNCQIRIEPARRRYDGDERDRLSDLFGQPSRWGETMRSFLWTHASVSIPAVDAERMVDLPAPCSYDFNIAATKYFHGLEQGDVPLNFLFSGSIFYRDSEGRLQIEQVAWSKECAYRLPLSVWRAMMDHYYPQSMWLCLHRDAFEELDRYRRRQGLPTFERALQALLEANAAEAT